MIRGNLIFAVLAGLLLHCEGIEREHSDTTYDTSGTKKCLTGNILKCRSVINLNGTVVRASSSGGKRLRPPNEECAWDVHAPKGHIIHYDISCFHIGAIKNMNDSVCIDQIAREAEDSDESVVCGHALPQKMTTYHNREKIFFHTLGNKLQYGFSMQVFFAKMPDDATTTDTATSDTLTTSPVVVTSPVVTKVSPATDLTPATESPPPATPTPTTKSSPATKSSTATPIVTKSTVATKSSIVTEYFTATRNSTNGASSKSGCILMLCLGYLLCWFREQQ